MKRIQHQKQLLTILDALSHPVRLKIISSLFVKSQYVSELARSLEISRPLLYLHLQKIEEAKLITSNMEISETGKALKYYKLNSFQFEISEKMIHKLTENKGDC
ncbi:ArsR/SmtB family transcription factor [Amphibacillus sediminis]|uniref:ArsR/SmtB family transcription factor n=1 Tax=Amphibacillus sediminis TaxID=360185 RepID=UPI0008325A2C|nr:winged helix-turn-helix domain-containing protein [Amphibacillus sediminis]